MSAGTITLTNNSATVNGSGTTFTDLESGDFIVAKAGGTTYTLAVSTVDSATQVTLVDKYTGPTQSGLAWNLVPRSTQNQVTAELVAQATQALRGLNYDKANWQQVFSGAGDITVTMPDGTQYSGPSWSSLTNSLSSKASSGANSDITALNGITNTIEITGCNPSGVSGAYNSSPSIRTTIEGRGANSSSKGGFAALSCGEHVGTTAYGLLTVDWEGHGSKYWNFYVSGNANAPGSWVNGSDERHKSNIECVKNPLAAVLSWRGCTYDKLDGGSEIGLIAQDVEPFCPEAVINTGRREFSNGKVIEDFKSLNTAGVAAAFHTEAIKVLFGLIKLALDDPAAAREQIAGIETTLRAEENQPTTEQ